MPAAPEHSASAPPPAPPGGAAGAAPAPAPAKGGEVVKGRIDTLQYRIVTLPNGLRAALASDPAADKAAAAADVRVGSLSDPPDVPGLAHFTEHMLFYASNKYPVEDEYSKFIAERGGHTNAWTSAESTNYQLEVNAGSLAEALDRFSQFFICPLISADGVEREAKAVDSEHAKNLNSDAWRAMQLWKATANPASPFSRFATGTYDTLVTRPAAAGAAPRDLVAGFHAAHNSAPRTRVAVVGRESLDELEALVAAAFSAVPAGPHAAAAPPAFAPDALAPEHEGALIRMVPQREGHAVEVQWATAPEAARYRAAPLGFLSHLLGHEGPGSVFAALKARGWITALVAGEAGTSFSAQSFFMVRMELTDEGCRRVKHAVAAVFAYVALLAAAPAAAREAAWREAAALADLRFQYAEKADAFSLASSLAHGMHSYADADLLAALHNVPLEYDAAAVDAALADLAPRRARVMWASPTLAPECAAEEAWYGTKYSVEKLPADWLAAWEAGDWAAAEREAAGGGGPPPALHLPDPNPFIPTDFSLVPESAPAPMVTVETPSLRLWHRPVPDFGAPRGAAYLHLHLPEAYASPRAAVLTALLVRLVNDRLAEHTYAAELAGARYGLRPTTAGLLLSGAGFAQTLPRLMDAVVAAVLGGGGGGEAPAGAPAAKSVADAVPEDRFRVVKEKVARDYANTRHDQPYQVALHWLGLLLEARRWSVDDYERELPALRAADLAAFAPRLLGSAAWAEALVAGNVPAPAAAGWAARAAAALAARGAAPPAPGARHEARVVRAPPGGAGTLLVVPGPAPANDNSAVVVCFQLGRDAPRLAALAQLAAHVGRRPAFHQLRTVEQLGYLTWFSVTWTLSVINLAFVLQSAEHSAAHLEARVDAFLPALAAKLRALPEPEFAEAVDELAKSKLEKLKRLRDAAARDWREIDDGTLSFSRQEDEVAALRALSRAELAEWFEAAALGPRRARVVVRVVAEARRAADAAAAADAGEAPLACEGVWGWKRRQELLPGFR